MPMYLQDRQCWLKVSVNIIAATNYINYDNQNRKLWYRLKVQDLFMGHVFSIDILLINIFFAFCALTPVFRGSIYIKLLSSGIIKLIVRWKKREVVTTKGFSIISQWFMLIGVFFISVNYITYSSSAVFLPKNHQRNRRNRWRWGFLCSLSL